MILAHIYDSLGENYEKLRTASSTSATWAFLVYQFWEPNPSTTDGVTKLWNLSVNFLKYYENKILGLCGKEKTISSLLDVYMKQ